MEDKELQTEIHKANLVISKLQQEVGRLSGRIALLETENEAMATYFQQQQESLEEEEEDEKSELEEE